MAVAVAGGIGVADGGPAAALRASTGPCAPGPGLGAADTEFLTAEGVLGGCSAASDAGRALTAGADATAVGAAAPTRRSSGRSA